MSIPTVCLLQYSTYTWAFFPLHLVGVNLISNVSDHSWCLSMSLLKAQSRSFSIICKHIQVWFRCFWQVIYYRPYTAMTPRSSPTRPHESFLTNLGAHLRKPFLVPFHLILDPLKEFPSYLPVVPSFWSSPCGDSINTSLAVQKHIIHPPISPFHTSPLNFDVMGLVTLLIGCPFEQESVYLIHFMMTEEGEFSYILILGGKTVLSPQRTSAPSDAHWVLPLGEEEK